MARAMTEPADELPPREGGRLLVRPIRWTDAAALTALHARQSTDTIYRRYFAARPSLPPADVERFTRITQEGRFALVAIREPDDLVAVARYEGGPGDRSAELAAVVDDALQHRGVGRALLGRLVDVACERGLAALVAHVLNANSPMLALLRSLGLPSRATVDGTAHTVIVDLAAVHLSDERRDRARRHITDAGTFHGAAGGDLDPP